MNTSPPVPAKAAARLLQAARFEKSVPEFRLLPADTGTELAFAGRSNCGKSSAINLLCNQRNLARTSRTPGRTQHLVVFALDEQRRLIDLPGFGYAKVSKSMRSHWNRELPRYLEQRRSLGGLVLLMDIRHPLKAIDQIMVEWCRDAGVPLVILLSKADKLGRGAASRARLDVIRVLAESFELDVPVILFSALKRQGIDEAYTAISVLLDDSE